MQGRPALQHPWVGMTLAGIALEWMIGVPLLYALAFQGSFEHQGPNPYGVALLVASLGLGLAVPIVGATTAALLRWRFVAAGFGLMLAAALAVELAHGFFLTRA